MKLFKELVRLVENKANIDRVSDNTFCLADVSGDVMIIINMNEHELPLRPEYKLAVLGEFINRLFNQKPNKLANSKEIKFEHVSYISFDEKYAIINLFTAFEHDEHIYISYRGVQEISLESKYINLNTKLDEYDNDVR